MDRRPDGTHLLVDQEDLLLVPTPWMGLTLKESRRFYGVENAGSEANRLTGWPQITKVRYSDSTFFLEQSSEVGIVPQDLGISLPRGLDPPVAENQERMAHF